MTLSWEFGIIMRVDALINEQYCTNNAGTDELFKNLKIKNLRMDNIHDTPKESTD